MSAYEPLPSGNIPSYSSDGTTITIPRSSLSVTTGDVRQTLSADDSQNDIAEVLFAILNVIFKEYSTNDAPTKWSMSRSSSTSGSTGSVSFGVSFQTTIPEPPTQTVTNEA